MEVVHSVLRIEHVNHVEVAGEVLEVHVEHSCDDKDDDDDDDKDANGGGGGGGCSGEKQDDQCGLSSEMEAYSLLSD